MIGRWWFFACLILASCHEKETVVVTKYADVKGFFHQEVIRLKKQRSIVTKTVSRNDSSETKVNVLPNWETELSLFTESDINKPAWSDSYLVRTSGNNTAFTALDPHLRTRSILLKKDNSGRVAEITITNSTKNYLYSASEDLFYIPDSVYRIKKKQDVVILGNNSYEISGFFK